MHTVSPVFMTGRHADVARDRSPCCHPLLSVPACPVVTAASSAERQRQRGCPLSHTAYLNQAPLWGPFWTASNFGTFLLAMSIFQKQQFSPSIRTQKPLILKPEYSSKRIEKEAGYLEATKGATVLNTNCQLNMIEIKLTAIRSCYRP